MTAPRNQSGANHEWTSEEFQEFMKCKMSPAYFIDTYAYTLNPVKGRIKFKLYDFQHDVMKQFQEYVFNIILKPRQMGLSWLVAGYVLWLCIFHEDKNVLMISIKERAAKRLLDKVKYIYTYLPIYMKCGHSEYIQTAITFNTGSRVESIPTSEDAGRSEAVSLLVIDEAAFVRWIDEIWAAAFPTLSTGGQAILLSTANGMGNFFHKIWSQALKTVNDFNAIKLKWQDHPDRDAAWHHSQVRNLGKRRAAQEVDCDFLSSGTPVLDLAKLRDLEEEIMTYPKKYAPVRTLKNDALKIYKEPKAGREYVIGADVATGSGEDSSACVVLDRIDGDIVATYRAQVPVDIYADILVEMGTMYNGALLGIESNSIGLATLIKVRDSLYPNLFYRYNLEDGKQTQRMGWETTPKTKPVIIQGLEEAVRMDYLQNLTMDIIQEGYTFIWHPDNTASAASGYCDDMIMALAIAWELRKHQTTIWDLPLYIS
jgi:hypothetical protein